MKMGTGKKPDIAPLRHRAEDRLKEKKPPGSTLDEPDLKKLVHELQVHQIELEMQNEELNRAREEVEEVLAKYTDLYDFAPVGYLTLDEKGLIVELNLTAAQLLGIERTFLVNKPFSSFIQRDLQDRFYLHLQAVLKSPAKQTCELVLKKKDGTSLDIQLESIVMKAAGRTVARAVLTDITEHKRAEEEREKHILELREALSQVKLLSGLLPICASCKKIRNDKGYWEQIELYIRDRSEADFSHSICPECAERLYPEYFKKK